MKFLLTILAMLALSTLAFFPLGAAAAPCPCAVAVIPGACTPSAPCVTPAIPPVPPACAPSACTPADCAACSPAAVGTVLVRAGLRDRVHARRAARVERRHDRQHARGL